MRNFEKALENSIEDRGLHCIWLQVGEGNESHLVARWIAAQPEANEQADGRVPRSDGEAEEAWLCADLQFA